MNKTKVIATVGPVSQDKEMLKVMIQNGVDVIRLNLSHADHDFCTDIIEKVRTINSEIGTNVAIMLDTKGPDVRIGKLIGGESYLKTGDKIRIYMDEIVGDNTKFSVNYKHLIDDVSFNTILKLSDGALTLQVIEKGMNYLLCEVLVGGIITDHKSVNVPGIKLHIPFLGKKDIEDIEYASDMNVDFLALSFVSSSEDILSVNDKLIELGNDHLEIIAKIECEAAVEDLDEIIKVSNGVMVARGDLGVELPIERVPGIQKQIIHKCHKMGKVSIVATDMLASMEMMSRPTRAEVSDIANAVLDGSDAVMLSGETTVGKHPLEAIQMMERIIASAEQDIVYEDLLDRAMRTEKQDITGMIAYSVTECANRLHCKAIIAPTVSGYTARKMSRFRPSCPIIAISPNESTVRSLALHFGVYGVVVDELNSFDKMMNKARQIATKNMHAKEGDRIIITGGYPFKDVKHTNFMKIEEL